jgi:mono/diheme cytochrome c family protein
MRSVMLAVVILTLAIGMTACAPATPVVTPSTVAEATSAPVVAATEAATAAPAPTDTSIPATAVPAATNTSMPATVAPAATTAPAPTTAPVATTAPAATTASGGEAGSTAGELAQAGQTVYTTSCAGCHGAQGQGGGAPAVVGSAANLAKHETGQGLYDYVHTRMPARAPGSLTDEQYLQVVIHLLVQNDLVDTQARVSQSTLEQIEIK